MKGNALRALLCLPALLCALAACAPADPADDAETRAAALPSASGDLVFTQVAAAAGIDFRHVSGHPSDKRAIYESISGGIAWLDFDGDDHLDLFIINSGHRLRSTPPPPEERTTSALFRNRGDGTFEDVTAAAGLTDWRWGIGVAVGDHDSDGDPDLYVTRLGPNALWRNNGDGTFTDVARQAGVDDPGPGSGAAFGDIDADGTPDLYVANYVPVAPDRPLPGSEELCTYRELSVYCGPRGLPHAADVLYRGRGDGTFEDVSRRSGIVSVPPRHSYDVLFFDVENDGDQDIYIAADQEPSLLFVNDGTGRFEDRAVIAGVALGEAGRTQAGMGVDIGDVDGDGLQDIVKTNFESEVNNLYINAASGLFADRAYRSGLSGTIPSMGWGIVLFDADADGFLDLYVANGHVYPQVEGGGLQMEYAQLNQLYRGSGGPAGPRFRNVSQAAGSGLAVRKVSRGVALGDYDGDGDLDIAVNNVDATPDLLRNDTPRPGNWLVVRAEGTRSSRHAYGARVTLRAGGVSRVQEVRASRGFLSSSDPRLHFGLGRAERVDALEVRWPAGGREAFAAPAVNRVVVVREGEGEPLP